MLNIVLVRQVQQDGTTLEDPHIPVCDGGNAAVGINLREPFFLLFPAGDVNFCYSVWKAELLERYGHFDAIAGEPGVKVDVWLLRHCSGGEEPWCGGLGRLQLPCTYIGWQSW